MTKIEVRQRKIGIIGAGWLGQPLAQALTKEGAEVLVTRRDPDAVANLNAQGLKALQLSLPCTAEDFPSKLLKRDCLIISIPPGLRHGETDYQQKLEQLVSFVQSPQSEVKQLILISSTAVYNGLNGVVTERSKLNLQGNKVEALAAAEQVILNSPNTNNIVLRLGGLMGYNRQPGRFFTKDSLIPNPDSVINFIHQDDVIGLLNCILQYHCGKARAGKHIYNGVTPHHPSRRDFYQLAMKALGQDQATFAQQQETEKDGICGKQVDSVFVDKFGYNFKHHDLLDWLINDKD